MSAISDFFAMAGYGIYIWPAYGLTALIMLWFLFTSLRRLRARESALDAARAARGIRRRDASS